MSSESHTDHEYWRALGEFIEAFALAEDSLFQYVCRITEWPMDIARVAAAGWHTEAMVQFVRKMWKLRPLPANTSELVSVLEVFMDINALRNSVIHNRSYMAIDGTRVSTNKLRRRPASELAVSPRTLADATADLNKIDAHLLSALINPTLTFQRRAESWEVLGTAWLYKRREA